MLEVTTLSEITIDGKLSLGAGQSSKELFGFYGDDLKVWSHTQRAMSGALMVGANTVRTDDPELSVRYCEGRNPLRVVPSSNGRLPLHARILNDGQPTLVVVSRSSLHDAVSALCDKPLVEVIACGDQQVDLVELMSELAGRGIESLLVEGGSRLLYSLFEADLVSRIIIKHIPVIAGAVDAPPFLQLPVGGSALQLSRWRTEQVFVVSGVCVSIYQSISRSP